MIPATADHSVRENPISHDKNDDATAEPENTNTAVGFSKFVIIIPTW